VIKARFFNKNGEPYGFDIFGHADFAAKGYDIVCACVSSAVQMTANTITEVIKAGALVGKSGGKITLRLISSGEKEKTDAACAVIKGLRLHLSVLSEQYRGTICIEDSEV
jgi:uncharacterized protein YsxB (DUF464 family)